MIKPTTATYKILDMTKKVKVVQGGQGAGKTFSMLLVCINLANRYKKRDIVIYGKERSKMNDTVIKDFSNIMDMIMQIDEPTAYDLYKYNKVEKTATFPNGSTIKFRGMDDKDVGKGNRIDDVYFNEANKFLTLDIYNGIASRVKHNIYLDFNPNARFFIHDLLLERNDMERLILTYKDNEFCPESEVQQIMDYKRLSEAGGKDAAYYANLYKVFGLGEIGSPINVVFDFAKECAALPENYKKRTFGIDFGFANDPTTIVELRLFEGEIYTKEHLYHTGMFNSDIAAQLQRIGVRKDDLIVCDSASPKDIMELRTKYGCNTIKCKKSPTQKEIDIKELRKYGLYITSDSRNAWREQERCSRRDNGTIIDGNDHFFDALRYGSQGLLHEGTLKMIG